MDEIKTLIFRTDRLGDFLISCPFILSYKKKFHDNKIEIVSSEYNSKYISSFDFINNIIPLKTEVKFFPKLLILVKIIFYLRQRKYNDIIVLDGKKRSFFISLFLNGNKSILLQNKKLWVLSKIFNYKSVINYEIQNQLKNFSYLASLLNFNIDQKKIDIYKNFTLKKKYHFEKKYIIIHLDEKWFSEFYYRDFTDINPNSKQIDIFINKILNITKNNFNLIFTNGSKKNNKLDEFYSSFRSNDKIVFNKTIKDNLITYLPNLSFRDLEVLVKDSSFLICCEGGISHVSHNFNIPTIAFFEKRRIQHMKFWTGHMDKLQLFPRKKMDDLINDKNFFNLLENKLKQI